MNPNAGSHYSWSSGHLEPSRPSGDLLTGLMANAREEVLLAAPFVTRDALMRVVDVCPPGVHLTLVGRFLPEDVAAGVTQLEAAEYILSRSNLKGRVLRNPLLHGKLYRADEHCLVGSSNLTLKGLGWAAISNLEILIQTPRTPQVQQFESQLFESSSLLTEAIIRDIGARAALLGQAGSRNTEGGSVSLREEWLPTCRNPQSLFDVYADQETWKILESVKAAAHAELDALGPIPRSLDRTAFDSWVAGSFRRHPLVEWIRAEKGVAQGAAIERIRDYDSIPLSAGNLTLEDLWEVFQEWLLYFLGSEFLAVPTGFKIELMRRL